MFSWCLRQPGCTFDLPAHYINISPMLINAQTVSKSVDLGALGQGSLLELGHRFYFEVPCKINTFRCRVAGKPGVRNSTVLPLGSFGGLGHWLGNQTSWTLSRSPSSDHSLHLDIEETDLPARSAGHPHT